MFEQREGVQEGVSCATWKEFVQIELDRERKLDHGMEDGAPCRSFLKECGAEEAENAIRRMGR